MKVRITKPQKYLQNTIKMKKISLLLIAAAMFSGCSTAKKVSEEKKDDNLITLKFIQVNDVYEIAPLGGGLYGGMARVAHVSDSIKKENPNTMLLMAGDFLNPSLLGTLKMDGERINGKHMIDVMNAMNFDLATFGNHEFDVGKEALQKRLNESMFPWTSANVKLVNNKGNVNFSKVREGELEPIPETYQKRFTDSDGTSVNIGFFSVTIDSNPVDFVYYEDFSSESTKAYNTLKDTTDIVFGFTHLSLEQDEQVAKLLPEVPLIMGGHEHSAVLVPTQNGVIAKADANAKTVYIHTVNYNSETKETNIDSFLMPIDNTTPSKPEVKVVVDKWTAILEEKIKEVIDDPYEIIYTGTPPLDGTDSANRSIQTNLGDVITAGMAYAFHNEVDAALVNGGSIRIDDLLPKQTASLDIFRTLPFGGSIVKVKITGALLKEVLDYGVASRGTGAYLQRYNITKNATYGWNVGESEIELEKVYTIAFSDFLLKGYDIPFLKEDNIGVLEIYEPKPNEMAHDIRKAVIDYLKSQNN